MHSSFFLIRSASRLEQDEAAAALGISIMEIQEYESGSRKMPFPEAWLKHALRAHLSSLYGPCSNKIYGVFPLTIFRKRLEYSLERTAHLFGYTPEQWRRFELHQEQLPEDMLRKIERYYTRRSRASAARDESAG